MNDNDVDEYKVIVNPPDPKTISAVLYHQALYCDEGIEPFLVAAVLMA